MCCVCTCALNSRMDTFGAKRWNAYYIILASSDKRSSSRMSMSTLWPMKIVLRDPDRLSGKRQVLSIHIYIIITSIFIMQQIWFTTNSCKEWIWFSDILTDTENRASVNSIGRKYRKKWTSFCACTSQTPSWRSLI